MVSVYRFLFVLLIGAMVAMAALNDRARRGFDHFGGIHRAQDGPSVAGQRPFEGRSYGARSAGEDRGQGSASRWTEPDPVKMAREFLPIDREAFEAADVLLHAAPGSDEFRHAEGRLIREAGETTGRMLRDTAKEALQTVRSKEFWKGLSGK